MATRFVKIRKPHISYRHDGQTHGRQVPLRVVLHDTESHDAAGISDIASVYGFWDRQGLGYGAHFVVDGTGNIGQGGRCRDMMWHVGGFNTNAVGIEQIGFASFTRLIWSRQRRKQLRSVAKLLAFMHHAFGIPLEVGKIDPSNPSASRGIFTHAMVSKAGLPNSSGHTDPGKGYPLYLVVMIARRYVKQGGWYVEV